LRGTIDLVGKKFGRLIVIKRNHPNSKSGAPKWLCKCNCGKEKVIEGGSLRSGATKSCGCLANEFKSKRRLIDLTGRKFGKLTVIKRSYPNGNNRSPKWLCKCECGKEKIIFGDSLRNGITKSCGCLHREIMSKPYGFSRMQSTISRYKKQAKKRGIKYKLTEKQFKEITQKDCYYCGTKPNNISKSNCNNGSYIYNGIDRIDNTKGYTTDNVVPCCKRCNRAKDIFALSEFEDWIKKIHNNLKQKERSKE